MLILGREVDPGDSIRRHKLKTMSTFELKNNGKAHVNEKKRLLKKEREKGYTVFTPYIQLARLGKFPFGILFVLWSPLWAATMGAYRTNLPWIDLLKTVAGCAVAATIVNCMICTLNDIMDREIDGRVERTKSRPLPSGRISLTAAVVFLLAQVAGLMGLVMFYTRKDVVPYAAVTLGPLHGLYPLMKRLTYWPQAWLGMAGATGGLVAWQYIVGEMDWSVMGPFFVALTFWAIHFDTVYAFQDKEDDKKLGLGSTAILFSSLGVEKPILYLIANTFVGCLAYAGYVNGQGWPCYTIGVAGAWVHLMRQIANVDLEDERSCFTTFASNEKMGWFVWGGLLIDYARRTGLIQI